MRRAAVAVFPVADVQSAVDAMVRVQGHVAPSGPVTYWKESSQWSVMRAEFDRGCGEAGVLYIEFPTAKKKQFDGVVATMSKSFRADLCG